MKRKSPFILKITYNRNQKVFPPVGHDFKRLLESHGTPHGHLDIMPVHFFETALQSWQPKGPLRFPSIADEIKVVLGEEFLDEICIEYYRIFVFSRYWEIEQRMKSKGSLLAGPVFHGESNFEKAVTAAARSMLTKNLDVLPKAFKSKFQAALEQLIRDQYIEFPIEPSSNRKLWRNKPRKASENDLAFRHKLFISRIVDLMHPKKDHPFYKYIDAFILGLLAVFEAASTKWRDQEEIILREMLNEEYVNERDSEHKVDEALASFRLDSTPDPSAKPRWDSRFYVNAAHLLREWDLETSYKVVRIHKEISAHLAKNKSVFALKS